MSLSKEKSQSNKKNQTPTVEQEKTKSSFISNPSVGLDDGQKRLVRSISFLMQHVLTAKTESEYFDGSAELIRMVASLIKQSNFTSALSTNHNIAYDKQALEFALEVLQESMDQSKVITYDN